MAVLLGRALDARRGLLARLRNRDTITAIEVHASEYFELIKGQLQTHVLGTDTNILEGSAIEGSSVATRGTVALCVGKDEGATRKSPSDNGRFADAIQRRCTIIGIAINPERQLPADLVRLAGDRIVEPPLDGNAIAAVIEAVTGRHPGPVEDALARKASGARSTSRGAPISAPNAPWSDCACFSSATKAHRPTLRPRCPSCIASAAPGIASVDKWHAFHDQIAFGNSVSHRLLRFRCPNIKFTADIDLIQREA